MPFSLGHKHDNVEPAPLLAWPALAAITQAATTSDEAALSDPDLYTRDPDRFAVLTERIARNRTEIEAAESRWLEVAEMAEALAR